MKKSIIISSIFAVVLAGTLFSLPKVVVNNQANDMEKSEETSTTDSTETVAGTNSPATNSHDGATLSPEQQKIVDQLRSGFNQASEKDKVAEGIKLLNKFTELQKFDSAAHYAEKIAVFSPTIENLVRTGDRFYDAFGFAMDDKKSKALGAKTREYYTKALDLNPNLLGAKANMAMTYVNTENPMQGILILREILDTDPTNELALFNLGILSMRSNQYSKAIDRFKQILTNNPANTKAKFYLGISLVELGKNEDAKKVLAEVKKDEKDPMIQQAVKELEDRMNNQ